ncbi:Hypothetical protein FKW44_002016, partial [Caligus rogercresseyi]
PPDLNPMDYCFWGYLEQTHQPTGSPHQGRPDQLHNEAGHEVGQGPGAKALLLLLRQNLACHRCRRRMD